MAGDLKTRDHLIRAGVYQSVLHRQRNLQQMFGVRLHHVLKLSGYVTVGLH